MVVGGTSRSQKLKDSARLRFPSHYNIYFPGEEVYARGVKALDFNPRVSYFLADFAVEGLGYIKKLE